MGSHSSSCNVELSLGGQTTRKFTSKCIQNDYFRKPFIIVLSSDSVFRVQTTKFIAMH